MLRGVHHRIVEIRQTEHPYFERALLFVRADCEECREEQWVESGRLFVRNATPYTGLKRSRVLRRLQIALYLVCSGIGGVIVGALLSKIG